MYEVVQAILVVIGAILIGKGIWNVARGYNIDKFLSMLIYKKTPKYNGEKRK